MHPEISRNPRPWGSQPSPCVPHDFYLPLGLIILSSGRGHIRGGPGGEAVLVTCGAEMGKRFPPAPCAPPGCAGICCWASPQGRWRRGTPSTCELLARASSNSFPGGTGLGEGGLENWAQRACSGTSPGRSVTHRPGPSIPHPGPPGPAARGERLPRAEVKCCLTVHDTRATFKFMCKVQAKGTQRRRTGFSLPFTQILQDREELPHGGKPQLRVVMSSFAAASLCGLGLVPLPRFGAPA